MTQHGTAAHFFSRLRGYFIYNPLIWLYTIVLGVLSLISSLFDGTGRMQHGFARLWSSMILGTIGSRVQVIGLEKVDVSKPHVYAVNHISALDIPVLYAHLPMQFRIMAKKELFRYPFLGWHLTRSGQVPIDRENALASLRSLGKAIDSLKKGMPLVVFPEGGRSEDGHVKPFLAGAFYAAIKAGVEVVPVALVGTYEMLPMNTYHIKPRTVEMVVGEPIATTGMNARQMDDLASRTQQAVEDLYYSRCELADPRRLPQHASTTTEAATQ